MVTCPACSSSRTLIHLDASRRGRCLHCGAGWVQEGAWQHSINRPRRRDGPRAVASIPVRKGMSGLDMAMAVVGELQSSHGAQVTGHDVVDGVAEISLRLRVPLVQRFEAQREQYATIVIRNRELHTQVMAGREALQSLRQLREANLRMARLELGRLAAERQGARRALEDRTHLTASFPTASTEVPTGALAAR